MLSGNRYIVQINGSCRSGRAIVKPIRIADHFRVCQDVFFQMSAKHKRYQALNFTDGNLGEMEILSIYLRRWSIGVVFKDLKQYFGYDQSKSPKYAP